MQKAIIHTATRVIRRVSIDDSPQIQDDESIVVLSEDISLGDGFWKLDGQDKKVKASQSEIDESGVDREKVELMRQEHLKAYKRAVKDAAKDATLPLSIQKVFQALEKLT